MSCTLNVYAKDDEGTALPVTVSFRFYTLKSGEWDEWNSSPFEIPIGTSKAFHLTETNSYKIVPLNHSDYSTPPEKVLDGCGTGTYDLIYTLISRPTISDISWSPKGNFTTLSTRAALTGATEYLKAITTNPIEYPELDEGEALLEIISKATGETIDSFTVKEYDHFRFDNKEWWALNIVCGPECDLITLADEDAEALRTPKVGDEIQFTCNIDWHGVDPDRVEWYYAKAPNRCFSQEEVAGLWTRFATTQLPTHAFENDDDHEITFIKVLAKNANGDIGELGNTCRPIFNLWSHHPSWWESILEAIDTVNANIVTPITDLFPSTEIEGWTSPPFKCPICGQVFEEEDSEQEYAEHLMSHIKAFEQGWFEQ